MAVRRLCASLVVTSALLLPARAFAVDMTGHWRLDFSRFGSLLTSSVADFAQNGMNVIGDSYPPDGAPEYMGFSFEDSAGGAVILDFPSDLCGRPRLFGRFAPDGNSLTGSATGFVFVPPGGCLAIQLDVVGTRIETTSVCGNGVVDVPSETCDDGNVTAGDGCGSDCRVEACSSCSGQPSHCVHTACRLCEPSPRLDCRTAPATPKVTLALKLTAENGTPNEGVGLTWKWSKGEIPLAEFGDPVHLADYYGLCVYDRSYPTPVRILFETVLAGVSCGHPPCWKATGVSGFTYKNPKRTSGNVQSIRMKAGAAGRAAIRMKVGDALLLLGLPVAEPVALTVQLQAPSGACWEADYDAAGVSANDADHLRARPE